MLSNMKAHRKMYFATLLLLFGCTPLKESMITTGENLKEIAIHNAILDFSTNCYLFKKDSVFSVTFEDSVFEEGNLVRVDEKANKDGVTHRWKRGPFRNGIVFVGIGTNDNYQFYYSKDEKPILPSRYVIKEGKLFYWWDHNYPVTEEMINILKKYDCLQSDLIIPEFGKDEKTKGADYYFCMNDLSKYKRVITNIAWGGYYKLPRLKCK